MIIEFFGGSTSVTGSCHILTTEKSKILLDCGLYQGSDFLDELNREPFGFNPADIDCVVLSHAHIDHSGRLPLLVKHGFRGKIYCTDATADLLDIMLKDSGHIQEKETEWKNRKNERAGRLLEEPLYTVKDAEAALRHLQPVIYDQLIEITEDIKIVFNDAGHVLGSAITEFFVEQNGGSSKLVYTGDLGRKNRPILRDPTIIKKADFIIMEATYGDRVHEQESADMDRFIDIILKTTKRGGNVIIPSFAVGRTQELIYLFKRYYEEHDAVRKDLEKIPVYVDSPMATNATDIFRRNAQVFDEETRAYLLSGDNPLDFDNLHFTRTSEESRALNFDTTPKIIISASGMCEAGRIKHHLKHNLWNHLSSVVFVGYQSVGTLGRSILDGDKDVSIFGEKIHVEAEIYNMQGLSGHADREGLLDWVGGLQKPPYEIFLVHGESDAKNSLANSIKDMFGYNCIAINEVSEYHLTKAGDITREDATVRIAGTESLLNLKKKMHEIHNNLDNILYNTHLAVEDMTPEQLADVNNLVLSIEKEVLNLGSAATLRCTPECDILSME